MLKMSCHTILDMPMEERPRERMLKVGSEALSSVELIAIILAKGTKGTSVLQLAQKLLSTFGTLDQLMDATVEELCTIKGLGKAKALQLKAAFSLGARAERQKYLDKTCLEHPQHVYDLVKNKLEKEKRECFSVLLRDTKGFLITNELVSIGTLSETLVHPREVFYPAIRHKAASIILVHNHPSGDPTPSAEDISTTHTLIEVGQMLGVPVYDHVIIGKGQFLSMRQKGLLFKTLSDEEI